MLAAVRSEVLWISALIRCFPSHRFRAACARGSAKKFCKRFLRAEERKTAKSNTFLQFKIVNKVYFVLPFKGYARLHLFLTLFFFSPYNAIELFCEVCYAKKTN